VRIGEHRGEVVIGLPEGSFDLCPVEPAAPTSAAPPTLRHWEDSRVLRQTHETRAVGADELGCEVGEERH
jgi:hypothetical protein